MKERSILFTGTNVRSILEGRKTHTRRIVKDTGLYAVDKKIHGIDTAKRELKALATQCPYGKPGDRLWVRETFRFFDSSVECSCYDDCKCASLNGKPVYRADGDLDSIWKPSIYMPRAASRITLEIVSVRVERLQDITEEDAKAEGVTIGEDRSYSHAEHGLAYTPHRMAYTILWESINGVGSWDLNPLVWVIEFRRVKP